MTLFADDLDASLQKMEDRLFNVIAKKVREQKLDESVLERKISSDISALEQRIDRNSRGVVQISSNDEAPGVASQTTRRLEEALNQWVEKIEVQLNEMHALVAGRASFEEVSALVQRELQERDTAIEHVSSTAQNAEKLVTRLIEDTLDAVEGNKGRFAEFEERFKNLARYVEEEVDELRR